MTSPSLPALETGCHLLNPTDRQHKCYLYVFHIQQNRWKWKQALLLYMAKSLFDSSNYSKDSLADDKQDLGVF